MHRCWKLTRCDHKLHELDDPFLDSKKHFTKTDVIWSAPDKVSTDHPVSGAKGLKGTKTALCSLTLAGRLALVLVLAHGVEKTLRGKQAYRGL